MRRTTDVRCASWTICYFYIINISCTILYALEHKKEIAKRLGRPLVQTNTYEDIIACDVINPDHIDVEFNSLGGLESIMSWLSYP
ncbi:hypothetical protein LIER_09061 [Lithospermum erythrorhizon]|uniref:Uncharacterized protein n=1 Tax=Lithospermum erythrorhizon TaxID=34254 RepID=A0AAV3PI84_LITER